MKKILALLAVVLGVVSCQTEPEGLDVNVGGEQEVAVCVSLPEATRANSAVGAFDNVDLANEFTIRYILQVYYNGQPSKERLVKYSDDKSVVFPVRLVPGRDYNFVVWADIVEDGIYADNEWSNDDGLHYNTTDLHNITLKSTWVAMDETRDAFTGFFNTKEEGVEYSSKLPINITLTRPFAKLRVITTDVEALKNLGIKPYKGTVKYTTKHRESFNACNGTYGEQTKENVELVYNIAQYADNNEHNMVLFTDYFFANNDVVKFTMDIKEANNESIKSNTFNTDIHVQRNYLTTIQGNILTDGNNVTVTVEDAFENKDNLTDEPYYHKTISSAAEFYAALNTAGEYTVISDIDITSSAIETRTTGAPAEGKVTTINLNGKTITVTNKTGEPFATVAAGNTLFLEGGNIVLTEGSTASFIENNGNVVLTNGTLTNVSGHANAAVVEGKVIVEENATVNDNNTTKVENWLADVLTNGGTYLFTENMTASKIIEVNATKAPVVLDGNGFTLTSTAGRAINVSGDKNVTIKNLNIVASGERAINIIQNAKNVTIENVTATAANYTVNVAGSAPGAVVAIKNSTLNGLCTVNVSSVGTQVTVDGSTVNCNDNNTTEGEAYAALSLNKDAVGGSIIATNSTINVTEGSDSTAGRNGAEDGVVTIDGSVERVVVMVAAITYPGSDYYHAFQTIAAAIDFAKSGDVISPIRNIELTEPLVIAEDDNVVLDLNGKTLAAKDVANMYAIDNCGTLTIKGNGTINARGIYNGYNGGSSISTAKLTIENGTFNAKGTNGGAAIYNYGVVEVKGGKFESTGGYGLNNQVGASMTITGGEIRGGIYNCGTLSVDGENTSVYQHISGRHAIYNYAATAIINNGAFDSESGNELILADGENSSVTINGGTFDKTAKSWLMGAATGKNITFVINGGTFRGYVNKPEMTVDTFRPYGDPIVVYGGNFNFNPTKWLSEDYKALETSEKMYVVVDKNVNGYVNSVITNQEGVTYTGDWFETSMNNALWFNNYIFGGEAAIKVVDKTYGAIVMENCSGNFKNDVFTIDNDSNSVMILENLNFTLAEGKKLIKSAKTIHQVFMVNIFINGEKMTQETIGKYLENVEWYQVVEEI